MRRWRSLGKVQNGLVEFTTMVSERFTGKKRFSDLNSEQQVVMLKKIEETDFFLTVRNLTISGMFAMPSYGGNKDMIGWEQLGFDHRNTWQSPFGYYDEQYLKDKENAS